MAGRAGQARPLQTFQSFGQVANGFEQEIRTRGAQELLCRERSEYGDRADSGALGHFQIFGRIANINTCRWFERKLPKSQPQRRRMRFLFWSVTAAHPRCKHAGKPELAQLPHDTVAVAARNQTQVMRLPQAIEHLTRSFNQPGRVFRILRTPGPVGIVPPRARQFRGSINAVPIWGVMARQFLQPPGNSHFAKHRQIRCGIRGIRINERAVPIKQHSF